MSKAGAEAGAAADPGSVVSDPQHSQKLLRALRSFRQDGSFQDAVLVLDGEEIPVQKNILAAASPYIRTKLNYNPPKEDGSTYRIELQGISMPIMKQILDYIFSGEISLSEDTIQDVVQAADMLLLTDLKSLCCQFLESCITAENCIGIRLFSLHYCLHHVHHVATEYLQTHFRDVVDTEEFRELPPERLCELLAMEKLNVGNERHVLEAVVRWLAYDIEARRLGVTRQLPTEKMNVILCILDDTQLLCLSHAASQGCVKAPSALFDSSADFILLSHNVAEPRPVQLKEPQIITLSPEACAVATIHNGCSASCSSLPTLACPSLRIRIGSI